MTYEDVPEKYRPEWPDANEPTASEWAGWYASLPFRWQVQVAEQILTRQRHDTRCFMNDHVGRIEELRAEVARLSTLIDQWKAGPR